ncbi:hypothetical protein G6F46_004253 [Rhizopus delemar]|uniref:Methyltransferase domain-containing protein n=2 Tax=Rhizopus TaxID=4842 RepID=A0A9P6Z7C2_9FUNG|nr:hypothetical protein G6F55_002923 [Rhizopus delemar]KAG1547111.1 hypothetical protein G6F51_004466 [Rhizopus arrhizus]KAG1500936.1 hypothetical protein G6F54_003374 [Rhizopus delemar]KAG1514550.1 hypothetical protein G6F53_003593 [Rhizopus delemar]KAG1527763.1 hypothetical protein G6F52_001245 [Rhizopus delemar]
MGTITSKDNHLMPHNNGNKRIMPSLRSQLSHKGKSASLSTEEESDITQGQHSVSPARQPSWKKSIRITKNDDTSSITYSSSEENEEDISRRTSLASVEVKKRIQQYEVASLSLSDTNSESKSIPKETLFLDDKFWKGPVKPFITYNKNDEREYERQLREHYVLKHIFKGNIHVPVPRDIPIIILDSDCGAGFWTLDMALEYPNAKVIGLEAFNERNGSKNPVIGAPNIVYKLGDLTSHLQLPANSVDIIHQRDAGTIIPQGAWSALLRELKRIAKPGGYIQLVEYNYVLGDAGPVLTLVNEWYENAAKAFGVDPSEVKRLKKFLIEAGFEEVNERIVKIPIGEWHKDKVQKENGFLYKQLLRSFFKSIKSWWVTELRVSEQEFDKVVNAALEEFDEQQSYTEWVIYTARKPI